MGVRLKELRKERGLTLQELSDILLDDYDIKISTGQLSSYENDKRSPRDNSTWEFLAKYFNVPVSYLLGYDDNDFEKRIRIDVLNDIINKLHKTHISLFETTDETAFWAGFEAAELIVQTQKMILEIEEEEN